MNNNMLFAFVIGMWMLLLVLSGGTKTKDEQVPDTEGYVSHVSTCINMLSPYVADVKTADGKTIRFKARKGLGITEVK